MKLIFVLLLITPILTGCGVFGKQRIVTETIEVKVPVLYSPKPPVIVRPVLAIHEMTEAQKKDAGTIAQYYKATIIQLLGYSKELEDALNDYQLISEALEEKANEATPILE